MSIWRFMNYLGIAFHDAEAIAKEFPDVTVENIRDAVSLLEDMVDFITAKDFFKVVDTTRVTREYLKKEDIAASLIHSLVGGPPQITHWDYRPENVESIISINLSLVCFSFMLPVY